VFQRDCGRSYVFDTVRDEQGESSVLVTPRGTGKGRAWPTT